MRRRRVLEVFVVFLVIALPLAVLGGAVGSEQKQEPKACCAGTGDLEGKHAKEESVSSCPAEKEGHHVYVNEDLKASLMARLKEEVQLTDEQLAQVKAALEAQKQEIEATMERLKQTEASQEEFRKAFQEAREEIESKMAGILTAEQMEKYKELKRTFRESRTKWQKEPREKEGRLLGGLSLTEEQKAKFDEITGRYHEKQREIFNQMMEELKGVLTPEQLEQFEALKEHHKQLWSRPPKALKEPEPVE